MAAPRSTAVVVDPRYRDHRGPEGHPERPDRLSPVESAIDARGDALVRMESRPAEPGEILRVHSRDHLALVEEAARRAPVQLDPDTYVAKPSLEVALLAAGGAIDLARAVAAGRVRSGLAAVRPPGHHAEAGRAMGFCLFNNVALAARAVQAEEGATRVLVVDWDVHHGNGTQHSFEDDPDVLYFSAHQFPYYPGTGDAAEAGRGKGVGATLNVPLPAGCGDAEWTGAITRVLAPAARVFRPDVVLVSCGFDAHADDPLAGMQVSRAGYAAMAHAVRGLAEELCEGRLALFLEGGYALSGLREGTEAVLDALLAPSAAPPAALRMAPGGALGQVVDRLREVHGGRFPDLGRAD